MPLQDHFHPPLSLRRHWQSFHNAWATYISSALNAQLPPRFFAEPNVHFGIQIDVATFEGNGGAGSSNGGWTPPAPTVTLPLALATDVVEIRLFSNAEGPVLAAAIELVSPANKDRPESREAFVTKCASYLQQGVGLIVIDVVTERGAELHDALLRRVVPRDEWAVVGEALFAAAYHPVQRSQDTQVDVWYEPVAPGQALPTLPLGIKGGPRLPVDLEATYETTCREQRLLI
jgi:hypothetical protein